LGTLKALWIFVGLQVIDFMTTRMALILGAGEQNPLISQFMAFAPVYGLLISKLVVVGLAAVGVWMHKSKGIGMANRAFAAVAIWNFSVIFRLVVPAQGL
jgi:uncharacterized protein DUF5658